MRIHTKNRHPHRAPRGRICHDTGGRPNPTFWQSVQTLRTILLLAGIVFFISGGPALAGDVAIEAGNQWIKGHADKAPLGEVLGQLSDQTGCEIFIDEKLFDKTVSFDMPEPVPSEQAIRRMVRPYSNAMVYEAMPGSDQIRIRQIKVFDKGDTVTRYVHAASRGTDGSANTYARGAGESRESSLLSGKGVSAGTQTAVQKVRPALSVEKGALGLPRFNYGSKGRGIDRRPSTAAMRKAFQNYRQESQAYNQRSTQSAMISGRQQSMQAQARYRSQRLQAIKDKIATSH